MRPYFSSYKGKVTRYRIVDIYEGTSEYDVLHLQNLENLSMTKLASNNVHVAKDEIMLPKDIIVRQYSRNGFGGYSKYFGAYASEGNTTYIDHSSYERYYEKHPFEKHKGLIFWILIILFIIWVASI